MHNHFCSQHLLLGASIHHSINVCFSLKTTILKKNFALEITVRDLEYGSLVQKFLQMFLKNGIILHISILTITSIHAEVCKCFLKT